MGIIQPGFFIVKNSLRGPDQSKSNVIDKFLNGNSNWERFTWMKEIDGVIYKRNYLFNSISKSIITSQVEGWMDEILFIMWGELQLKSITNGKKCLLIIDNFSGHKTDAVRKFFSSNNVLIRYMPPWSTSILQPMDLVVNSALKQQVRKYRGKQIYDEFQNHLSLYGVERLNSKRFLTGFTVSKPDIVSILMIIHSTLNDFAENEKFQESVRKVFNNLGYGSEGNIELSKIMKDGKDENKFSFRDMLIGLDFERGERHEC